MARGGRLRARPSLRIAALAVIVLALHMLVLRWVADALQGPPHRKAMIDPMFTRLLKPEAPVVMAETAAAPQPKRRRAIAAVREPAPTPARPASSASSPAPDADTAQAQPAASAPEAVASAAEPTASAPVAAASAPKSPASSPIVIAADSWPTDTRLSYRLTGWYDGELTGSARVQWLRQGERYETRVDLDLGIFGMQFLSQGEVTPESLVPSAYDESRPGRTRIDRFTADEVILNDGRKVPRPPGVQDTASHFVELSHRFSSGKEKLVVGGHTSMWLARPGGVDLWNYDIVSLDSLPTRGFGVVEAYHLKPRPIADARGDIFSEVWIAPTLQYLPVRIRITQGTQRYVDILVDKIEQR